MQKARIALSMWRKVLYILATMFVFGNGLTLWDMMASDSHKSALAAMEADGRIASTLGHIRWSYPIFFSYRSVAPPYKDCENRGYLVWSEHGFGFVGVRLRRMNMYRDPWDVYSIAIGYLAIPGRVSPACIVEFANTSRA